MLEIVRTTYKVWKINTQTNESELFFETQSGGQALEQAHALQAAFWGKHEEPSMNDAHYGPYVAHITNEFGDNVWDECVRLRCPKEKTTNNQKNS